MKLAELQGLFWRSVRQQPMPPEVSEHFVDQGEMSAQTRLKIYQDAYWYRQIDALFDCFPRLAQALGPEAFTRMVCRYLTEHPSEDPILERLGRKLADFLRRQHEPGLAQQADLAALEYARLLALLAPSPAAIATAADASVENLAVCRLALSPTLHTLSLRRDALARWDDPASALHDPALVEVAVWRKEYSTRHQRLEPDEALALRRAQSLASVAEIFETFAHLPAPEHRAFRVLSGWLQRHWILAFLPPPSP